MAEGKRASKSRFASFVSSYEGRLALATVAAIVVHLLLILVLPDTAHWVIAAAPLIAIVIIGGAPLVYEVLAALFRREAGVDLLAAVAIITSVVMGEWLVGAIIVLMLSGGEALEEAATSRASAVLDALADRSPAVAHRLRGKRLDEGTDKVAADDIRVGDRIVVLPHELVPVDGEVVEGHGQMDESYLTGEPYVVPKSVGSAVLSGAVNGEESIVIEAHAIASDSRYAQIVDVLTEAETQRPPIRRLADRLGGWYTAISLAVGIAGWVISGDPERFLAVVVIATPCPLLIGVPVAIIGAISLSAKRGIIVKNPEMLEQISTSRTVIFDKTGTLTYGRPALTDVQVAPGFDEDEVTALAAGAERYSRHPLAHAIVDAAQNKELMTPKVSSVAERPGHGLVAEVAGREITITNRSGAIEVDPESEQRLPEVETGLEAVVLIDNRYAATFHFRDQPRGGAKDFVAHLPGRHGVKRTMIISGDRESEVRYVADQVGIGEVHAGISPEGKLDIVREVTADSKTLFLGDGINDAPAMTASTVGVAFGAAHDVTSEAADAVVLDSSLERLDDLIHIGERMRRIALQSALGGIGISLVAMGFAVFGLITPIVGALLQEVIDLVAILNSARVAIDKGSMADFQPKRESKQTPATRE